MQAGQTGAGAVNAETPRSANSTETMGGGKAENGGQGRNRTADAGLFRAALYQLSYLATVASALL